MSKFLTYRKLKLRVVFFYLFFTVLLMSRTTFGQEKSDAVTNLTVENTIERQLKGGEVHLYNLALQAGKFINVTVEQKGIDVVAALLSSDGKKLVEINWLNDEGTERLSFICESDGNYQLQIRSAEITAASGHYELKLKELRIATEKDKIQIAAQQEYNEGKLFQKQETPESFQSAIKKYEAALKSYRAAADRYSEAVTHNNIGEIFSLLGSKQKAIDYFNQALPIRKAIADKRGEIDTLINLGDAYADLSENQKAIGYYTNAAQLSKAENDVKGEGIALTNIATSYRDLHENQKALDYYNQALRLLQIAGDTKSEARTYKNIGVVYFNKGDKQTAIEYLERGLKLLKELRDDTGEAAALNDIGFVYSQKGENQKAIEYYEQSLQLKRKAGVVNRGEEAATLNNIGSLYSTLGQNQKALEYLIQSLPLYRAVEDKHGEAAALFNIGFIYFNLSDNQKAIKYYNQALPLSKEAEDKSGESQILSGIGDVYSDLGDKRKALDYYNQSLSLSRVAEDKESEGWTLTSIGLIYFGLGENRKALEYYQQALPIQRATEHKRGEARTLYSLLNVWSSLSNPRLAIFYGKQSVNKYQELRQSIQGFEKVTQNTYLKIIEPTYRKLVEILVAEGRLFEAQQILAMLKEDEYFSYVRRDADEIKKLAARADLRLDEQAALAKYEQFAGKVTEYGMQFTKLEELKNTQGADFKQQVEYDELKTKLEAANAAFRIFLDKELGAELGKSVKKEIEIDRALQTKLQQWGNGTVALYTAAGNDRYRVILTTPKTQTDGKTEIKIADLNKKIFEFRAALQSPSVDPRPLGKELYDILIKPIEKDLQAAEAKTLLWSLDGTLRYIPFAALSPDGVHYLAEKYQNVVITSTTRQSLLAETDPNWRLLGAGVTKESKLTEPNGSAEITFSALPEVKNELLKIVSNEDAKPKENGLLSGIRLLDEGFDLTSLENGMTQRVADEKDKENTKPKYNVIHLATHFRLGGDTAKSFLLMGNNQALTLEKVSDDTALNFGEVELVTLSACNTGFGTALENKAINKEQERKTLEANNGAEVDSLATFIELRGAKAVLASLWSVADESTQMLMSEFYRLRKENPAMTKAEAMQAAQQAMISGKLKSSGKPNGCRAEIVNLNGTPPTAFKCDTNAPFAHPYFWSPFVLIGNWR